MIVWGKGEPCPVCGKAVPDEEHIAHFLSEHVAEL